MFDKALRSALLCMATFPLIMAPSGAAHAATHYDAVKNFTLKANPNGVWTYMSSVPLANKHRSYEGVPGLYNWSNDGSYPNDISIILNKTGNTVTLDGGTTTIPLGYLALDAQAQQPGADVVFVAPVAGTYSFKCKVLGLNTDEAAYSALLIVLNYAPNGGGQQIAYVKVHPKTRRHVTFTLALAAGDRLDFLDSSNGRKKPDYVGLAVKVTGP